MTGGISASFVKKIRKLRKEMQCTWEQDPDGNWATACGKLHILIDGTPYNNDYNYCPYCGKTISQPDAERHEI